MSATTIDVMASPDGLSDEERIKGLAQTTTAPLWLRQALALIARETADIAPNEDTTRTMRAMVYRH
jgi:hypothetical protein